jgi:hypothetical protein
MGSISPNNTPDNEANGFQYVDALRAAVCSKFIKTFVSDLDGDVVTITGAEISSAFGTSDFSVGVGDTVNPLVDFHISVAIQAFGSGDWTIHTPDNASNSTMVTSVDPASGDIDITLGLSPASGSNVRVTLIG